MKTTGNSIGVVLSDLTRKFYYNKKAKGLIWSQSELLGNCKAARLFLVLRDGMRITVGYIYSTLPGELLPAINDDLPIVLPHDPRTQVFDVLRVTNDGLLALGYDGPIY